MARVDVRQHMEIAARVDEDGRILALRVGEVLLNRHVGPLPAIFGGRHANAITHETARIVLVARREV